jgi:hypothetical protein
VLALIIAVAFAYRVSVRRDAFAPWLALAAYGLLGAALTAFGRNGLGDGYAIDSHYEAVPLFVPLATIGIVAACWSEVPVRMRSAWTVAGELLIPFTFGVDVHGFALRPSVRGSPPRRSRRLAERPLRSRHARVSGPGGVAHISARTAGRP